jgi:hypothetical protein
LTAQLQRLIPRQRMHNEKGPQVNLTKHTLLTDTAGTGDLGLSFVLVTGPPVQSMVGGLGVARFWRADGTAN